MRPPPPVSSPVNLGLGGGDGESDGDSDAVGENFGYLGADLKSPWDGDRAVWEDLQKRGVDSAFVGREHGNSASLMYQGVRLQYGQKSSTYDRVNYEQPDGNYVCSHFEEGKAVVGGTLIPLGEDGEILSPRIVLYTEQGRKA